MHRLAPLIPAAILCAGCALVLDARSQVAAPLEGSLPAVLASVPGYEATEQTISEQEQRVAGMTQYVARAFRRDSVVAFTTLVSYYDRQTHGKSIHSPRNCLPGAGWQAIDSQSHVLPSGATVNRYVIQKGIDTQVVLYWYQGRGRIVASEYANKALLMFDAARIRRTGGGLVRVIRPVTSTVEAATADLTRFADALLPHLSRHLP